MNSATVSLQKKSNPLNISLWIAQTILAAMFLMAGVIKSTSPIDQLSATLPWAKEVPEMLVRFIGISELLAGLGLLLPSILRIKPILTPIAASALVLIQLFAIGFHFSRGEINVLPFNISLLLLAIFIAWGRLKKLPIQAK